MTNILENFVKSTQQSDPVVHFYETFLAAYDAAMRKSRGVYYTPEPIDRTGSGILAFITKQ